MKTLNIGINLERGADFNITVRVTGTDPSTKKRIPTDITGYSFLGEIKSSTDPNAASLAEFDFAIQDQVLKKGQVQMSLPASEINTLVLSVSDPLQPNRLTTPFVYDVKMKDTANTVKRIIQGIAFVSPQATEESF